MRPEQARKLGYSNLTRILSRQDGLLERAEAALQHTVAADPTNAVALLRLGDVQRGKGSLDAALECYRRVLSLRPGDRKASWLVAILSGKELAEGPAYARPIPFVRRTDFLPPRRWSQLLALAQANSERFEPGTTRGEVDPSGRKALVESRVTKREVQPWFEAPLRHAFSEALPRLGMPELSEYWIEMRMSAYLDGGFFTKHTDNRSAPYRTDTPSFAYYFHRQPRRFSGGDLLLYDGGEPDAGAFTRIEPLHNSIVFFPAWAVHQITTVESDLGQAMDFADARLGIHGWLRVYLE